MARRKQFQMSESQRRQRRFSDSFKQEKVRELEQGITRPCELIRQYEVSGTTISRWIRKFGTQQKPERVIVESKSDTKKLLELQKKIAELERVIGQKQILIDFKDKMIELAEETYSVDIKKKFSTQPSNDTGKKGKNTPSA